ncbi:MAG TPA: sigma-70 family RNA polymerase sigma factor [Polyangia bacterium]
MKRYAMGDDGAFTEFYRLVAPRLLRYLSLHTRDGHAAEDLLQLTMMRIHGHRARFDANRNVMSWAFAIARSLLVDNYRAQRRQQRLQVQATSLGDTTVAGAEDLVSSRQLARIAAAELSRLPDNQRTVVELSRSDGLSLREIARRLGTTVNAIEIRIRRAYTRLEEAVLRRTHLLM